MLLEIGPLFQARTKHSRSGLARSRPVPVARPEPVKAYAGTERVPLPAPEEEGGAPLWEVIRRRRSRRRYDGAAPVTTEELSQLLWTTQGITRRSKGFALRAAPSAGALYPIETYLAVRRVEGLKPGLYHYLADLHCLERLRDGSFARNIAEAALDQGFVARADAVFVWSAVFARAAWKYGDRAYRYVYLDAGHIAQNLLLAATALGLGSCPIGAFFDDQLNAVLGLDGMEEGVIYLATVGRPRELVPS
ncbi:MAG: SagB/ThcOx family dehydrogenase [Thermoanaerobacterales bacterium]|nr:SagB/ThcOx family dehydrogenase [Thermoanaerobacterales bacterium]